jgi:hypothetical protein
VRTVNETRKVHLQVVDVVNLLPQRGAEGAVASVKNTRSDTGTSDAPSTGKLTIPHTGVRTNLANGSSAEMTITFQSVSPLSIIANTPSTWANTQGDREVGQCAAVAMPEGTRTSTPIPQRSTP